MIEIVLSKQLQHPQQWFFSAAVFSFVAFLAFLNMYTRAKKYTENDFVLSALGYLPLVSQCFCLLAVLVFLWCGWMDHVWCDMFLPVLAVAIIVMFALRTRRYWRRVVDCTKQA
jgi:peptidoglycan/LPS O-acetylase OafA/YrhL